MCFVLFSFGFVGMFVSFFYNVSEFDDLKVLFVYVLQLIDEVVLFSEDLKISFFCFMIVECESYFCGLLFEVELV